MTHRLVGAALSIGVVSIAICCSQCGSATTPSPEATPSTTEHNREGHDDACSPPNAGGPSSFTCEFDTQCVICHDGSACGIVVNKVELERRGEECEREDTAECEYSAPRCCNGYCAICSY